MGVECNLTPLECCSNSILHAFSVIITSYTDFDFYGVCNSTQILTVYVAVMGSSIIVAKARYFACVILPQR